ELLPVRRGGELVEAEISSDHRECFGVFPQTLLFELFLRESPSLHIPVLAIDASQPAFVLPRRCAEKDVSLGQRMQLPSQAIGLVWTVFGFEERKLRHDSGDRAL